MKVLTDNLEHEFLDFRSDMVTMPTADHKNAVLPASLLQDAGVSVESVPHGTNGVIKEVVSL
jgi:hypothetical protein